MTAESRGTHPTPNPTRRLLKAAHDLVFHHVHGGQLIYNACWEDPRIDRQLLQLGAQSRVVMITSAGCNALDYLLDGPREIHAIDVNYRQNSVLELKLALIRRGDFWDLFEMFGIGSHASHRKVYKALRPTLPAFAREFWDGNIDYFHPRGVKRSFYYHGTSGAAAWILGGVIFRAKPNVRNHALCLLDATTLDEQRRIYDRLEPEIWSKASRWLVRQRMVMTLLGVPAPQIKLIEDSYPGGLTAYVRDKLRHVMTELPTRDNYFWRVYITGSYTLSCCPNYLREENLAILRSRAARVRTHTCTISEFLRRNPGLYTHFVLLDHQDWLAHHDIAALEEEWDLVFANSAPGARVLLRSAGLDASFLPRRVLERLRFHENTTRLLHASDRVGTYGSLHFAEVLT